MGCCSKCSAVCGWLILVLGILFILRDFGIWDFFGIQWWSAVFIIAGVSMIATGGCKDCQVASGNSSKKKK